MSAWMEEKYPRWFVYDYYTYAGAPKLEDALMTWARLQYLHCLIAEPQLDYVVKKIEEKQEELWEQNKRLKKVDIHYSKSDWDSGHKWLYIGSQHLLLRKVKDEIL